LPRLATLPVPALTHLARALRRTSTDAEWRLWQHVRSRQLAGLRFRRQQPIGPFIVDFLCCEKMLIVEIDGGQHLESDSDRRRDLWLAMRGYRVLRFWNHEVLGETSGVLESIARVAGAR
jgi:very-short-patch-repair endonuclease